MKRLNLIPRQGKKSQPTLGGKSSFLRSPGFRIIFIALIFLAIGISAQFLFVQQYKWRLNNAKNQLQAAKVQLSRLQTEQLNLSKERQDLLKKKSLADARLEYLNSSKTDKPKELSEALVYLPSFMPDEIWINKLSVDREQMVINGSTLNNQAVSNLIENLNKSKKFRDSSFNFTQKSTVGDMTLYNFEIITHPVF